MWRWMYPGSFSRTICMIKIETVFLFTYNYAIIIFWVRDPVAIKKKQS